MHARNLREVIRSILSSLSSRNSLMIGRGRGVRYLNLSGGGGDELEDGVQLMFDIMNRKSTELNGATTIEGSVFEAYTNKKQSKYWTYITKTKLEKMKSIHTSALARLQETEKTSESEENGANTCSILTDRTNAIVFVDDISLQPYVWMHRRIHINTFSICIYSIHYSRRLKVKLPR